MGHLIEGVWRTEIPQDNKSDRWNRSANLLRNWITEDGKPGSSGRGDFRAELDRYHLYVAWNCPWAHRTLLFRQLKKLDNIITVSYVAPHRTDQGWIFSHSDEFSDTLYGTSALHEIYTRSQSNHTGRVTVPILWDKKTHTIVSNESADIIQMFDSSFEAIALTTPSYRTTELQKGIDAWNYRIQNTLNSGVYKAGFAKTQALYESEVTKVFETLAAIEKQLRKTRYLLGDVLTEADWRLMPTLVRFDVGYYSAFKCNLKRLTDYPNLWAYARELYQMPGIAKTIDFDIYRKGYHSASTMRNPHGIVPLGPKSFGRQPMEGVSFYPL